MATWAYIFEHPDTDPRTDRLTLDRAGQTTLLIPVTGPSEAAELVDELIADGVGLIELCGGFTTNDVSAVAARAAGRIPVGHVTFAMDSIRQAAAYAAAFDDPSPVAGDSPGARLS